MHIQWQILNQHYLGENVIVFTSLFSCILSSFEPVDGCPQLCRRTHIYSELNDKKTKNIRKDQI